MLELVKQGGWLMLPILFCSVITIAICIERLIALNPNKIAPGTLLSEVWSWIKKNEIDAAKIKKLKTSSPLGQILAAGLSNARHGREVMKESIEEAAAQVVHEMEHYLNTLGTIAAVTPLLGLLGTVIGMIKVFSEIMVQGTGNASVLAGGISEALITTASGLAVAIPALIMHRFFERRIQTIVVTLEREAVKLMDAMHADRRGELRQNERDAGSPDTAEASAA